MRNAGIDRYTMFSDDNKIIVENLPEDRKKGPGTLPWEHFSSV